MDAHTVRALHGIVVLMVDDVIGTVAESDFRTLWSTTLGHSSNLDHILSYDAQAAFADKDPSRFLDFLLKLSFWSQYPASAVMLEVQQTGLNSDAFHTFRSKHCKSAEDHNWKMLVKTLHKLRKYEQLNDRSVFKEKQDGQATLGITGEE